MLLSGGDSNIPVNNAIIVPCLSHGVQTFYRSVGHGCDLTDDSDAANRHNRCSRFLSRYCGCGELGIIDQLDITNRDWVA